MKSGFLVVLCLACSLSLGCSMTNSDHGGRSFFGPRHAPDQGDEPQTDDGEKTVDDEWGFVGQQGRGNQPREKESDRLSKWIDSPKALQINRNLGVE
jgi:hypothetical protein